MRIKKEVPAALVSYSDIGQGLIPKRVEYQVVGSLGTGNASGDNSQADLTGFGEYSLE